MDEKVRKPCCRFYPHYPNWVVATIKQAVEQMEEENSQQKWHDFGIHDEREPEHKIQI